MEHIAAQKRGKTLPQPERCQPNGAACQAPEQAHSPAIMNWESDPTKLRLLQEDIYRGKVLRARQLTVSQRLADVFACSNTGLELMFSGVRMHQPELSEEETWKEVGARIHRVRRLRDSGYYRTGEGVP